MKKIDMESWRRREVYEFFSGMSQPFYSVTFSADVTGLYDFVKQRGISFYYALVYLCTKAVNRVDNFRYVIKDKEVYLLEERNPSFTDLKKGSEQFHIVTMPCRGSIEEFCREAKQRSQAQTAFLQSELESDALIYFTCLPWVELTSMTNERDFDADDAIPRISWGKYVDNNGRKTLHLSLELNHRFVDGYHVGLFYKALQEEIRQLTGEPSTGGGFSASGVSFAGSHYQ